MISCTHATRLKGIRGRAIVVGPDRATNERRSLSLPRSTHPQSRRRQVDEWHEWLKFEEGEKTTIHKTSPSLPPYQFQLTPNRKRTRRFVELAAFQTLNEYTMGSWLQKRYQTRTDATEQARGISIPIHAFGIGHSRYVTLSLSVRHRRVQAWLGPFVTSARWNWIMDDPPITRLSGSKRFEHRCFGHRSTDGGEGEGSSPCIAWPSTFSLLLILRCNFFSFCFSFLFFFYVFCILFFVRFNPGRGRPRFERTESWTTVGQRLRSDPVFLLALWHGLLGLSLSVSRSNVNTNLPGYGALEVGDIRKYTELHRLDRCPPHASEDVLDKDREVSVRVVVRVSQFRLLRSISLIIVVVTDNKETKWKMIYVFTKNFLNCTITLWSVSFRFDVY